MIVGVFDIETFLETKTLVGSLTWADVGSVLPGGGRFWAKERQDFFSHLYMSCFFPRIIGKYIFILLYLIIGKI